ncbi:MAG: PEP-CTERM sorting domain-containing protein [Fimbriimonadaceae bacterium]
MQIRLFVVGAFLAVASVSSADIVLNQLDFAQATQHGIQASQDFEAANNSFDVIVIDDFTVTASQLNVINVEAMITGFAGFVASSYTDGSVMGYHVEFYTSTGAAAGNLIGNAGSAFVAPGAVTLNNPGFSGTYATARHIQIPVNITLPGAGTYWVGVSAVMNFTPSGQLGVNTTNLVLGNQNGGQANPGGGFSFPGNFQQGFTGATGIEQRDAQYLVEAVPEPGSMIALGLGAAALLARRRRKA